MTNNSWNSQNPAQVARGGTGLSSTTAYAVLCGGTTSTADFQSIASVGSSTEVLVSNGAALPTFQVPYAGDFQLISTATASSSATIEFNNLSSTYFMYMIVYEGVASASNAVEFWIRTSTDNGDNFDADASDYGYTGRLIFGSSTADVDDSADAQMRFSGESTASFGNLTDENASGNVLIYNPSGTIYTRVLHFNQFWSQAPAGAMVIVGAQRLSAADVDAVQFIMETGNIATGVFKLYGLVA